MLFFRGLSLGRITRVLLPYLLGLLAVTIALLLRENRYAPASLVLIALGCFWGLIRANKTFRRAIMAGSN